MLAVCLQCQLFVYNISYLLASSAFGLEFQLFVYNDF